MLNNKNGFSVIAAIFIVGFLFVLTSSILKLVLVELNDNRGRDNYLKSYYAAESAGEYAMLKIKQNGYGYYDKLDASSSISESKLLSIDSTFKGGRDPLISYDINSKVNSYIGKLNGLSYDIIPIYYIDDNGSGKLVDINLSITSGNSDDLSWNIISATGGLSGVGEITNLSSTGIYKTVDDLGNFTVLDKSISDFLNENKDNFNYLILFNSSESTVLEYNFSGNGNFFTKPRTEIAVSGKVGGYKQNLSIKYDNTEYLGMLKYSIFSN